MEAVADMNEVIDIFEIKPDISDSKTRNFKMKDGNIEFKNAGFIYDSGQKVFDNFDLHINQVRK